MIKYNTKKGINNMEVLKMHCPSCGASIDVEDGLDTFYCSHCGTKLLVSGQDKDTLNAKVTLRIAEKKLDLEYEEKEKQRRYALEKEKHDEKSLLIHFLIMGIFVIGLLLLLNSGFFSWKNIFRMWFG